MNIDLISIVIGSISLILLFVTIIRLIKDFKQKLKTDIDLHGERHVKKQYKNLILNVLLFGSIAVFMALAIYLSS